MATRNTLNISNINISNVSQSASPNSTLPIAVDQRAIEGSVERLSRESIRSIREAAVSQSAALIVKPFGAYEGLVATYPNDVVRLDIENANAQYLESNYRVTTYVRNSVEVTVDPEQDLSSLGYISGRYKTTYRFHRNLLGSGDAHKLQIQEISADGLEIRVIPALSTRYSNDSFLQLFSEGFFNLPKPEILPNLFLFKDAVTPIAVFDYVQDKFTYATTPYSIIFKLNAPAPDGVVIGDLLWLAQQVSDDLVDNITIVPPKPKRNQTLIAGPNWDAFSKQQTAVTTQYRDWDDLLSTNTQTSQDIINSLLSSSFIEGVPLNIDYKEFKNFIQFGSAAERLENFRYKMQLLENYNARIATLTTDLTGLPSSSVSSSLYYQNNINDAKTKKAALLGSMDGYEKYLYFESSSYESSSFGEFYPTTWPKSGSTKPYPLYSYSSSQVETWFEGIITSASLYDQNNEKALYRTIPAHVLEDPTNEEYVLFTQMIGHYFDLVYAYVKAMSKLYSREESLLEGFSKELVYHVAKNLGVDFENGTTLEELWSYTLGTDVTGSIASTYNITTQDKTKEIWKRIINNLPYLLKTKGTERGVRALINCFGIPQTILRIREYGGAEPDFDTKTDYVYERFNYSTTVGYNGGTTGEVAQLVTVPWTSISGSGTLLKPLTVELRAKMALSQSKVQRLLESTGSWYLEASKSGDFQYLNFRLRGGTAGSEIWETLSVSCSIYDGAWHLIALKRENETDIANDNQTYTLVVKRTNYEKVVSTSSGSLVVDGATSSSYNNNFVNESGANAMLWIPGTGSFPAATSHSMGLWSGSIQEFRYWAVTLQDGILNNHALAPTSYQSNTDDIYTGSTSSYYDLGYRITFGADNKKYNVVATASLSSSHPNQTIPYPTTQFYNFSGSYYNPIVEIHSLEWPDLGANRSISNKIRIDETFLAGTGQLRRDSSIVRSLTDQYPSDSPRLGVYLSPTNEVNQDIAEQFGGLSIDDFIGNPADLSKVSYPELDILKYEYGKKFTGNRNRAQNYIRLLKHYDSALFQLIKKFVPYRANTQVGLVVESPMINRSKVPVKLPTFEENHYSGSIDIGPETYITPGGFVEDGDGEPFRNMPGYVQEGVIGGQESYYLTLSGSAQPVLEYFAPRQDINMLPTLPVEDYDMVVLDGDGVMMTGSFAESVANQFNNIGIDDNPTTPDSMAAEINLGETAYGRDSRLYGSQYVFTSYIRSGSVSSSAWMPYTSSRYDYSEAVNPSILDITRSKYANQTKIYNHDIYGNKAFSDHTVYSDTATSTTITTYSSSLAINQNRWSSQYGFQVVSLITGSTTYSTPLTSSAYWSIRGGGTSTPGLAFTAPGNYSIYTASVRIPAFFYNSEDPSTYNLLYKITISTDETVTVANTLELHFGDLDCGLTGSITPTTTQTNVEFTTRALGNWLGLRLYINPALDHHVIYIPTLKVECLNYRAETQDFHLRDSYGMRTVRYDGSKLTSADWNVDSQDTIDGGPVVEVTVGGGTQLAVSPNVRGNLQIQ